ncbi:glycosyltransferase family 4 protein [Luteimonas suaedae]|uniref:glycosyltransferase family 4 protein n=1 Tax=Luteimonas suaedae TaxID=2605430 RepID=UPI0011EEA994|nr:glycosyltransferase family 4 protein [Luteimonas suaedae]
MERLNHRMLLSLAERTQVQLVAPLGASVVLPATVEVMETPVRPLWRFGLGALGRCLVITWRYRPRIVLAGSGLTAPFAWLAALLAGGRSVVYVHGLDLVAAHPVYRRLWLPAIRAAHLVLANSSSTRVLAIKRGVDPAKVMVLHPGVDVQPDLALPITLGWKRSLGLDGQRILLSVGRLTPRKGLVEFIEGAMKAVVAACPDVVLAVIGGDAVDALHGGQGGEGDRIEAAAARAGLQDHVRVLGRCDESALRSAYEEADLHVFPVRAIPGDVEGFGMVALEAAAHGLPTVAYAVGGVPDAIAEGRSGWLIPAEDSRAFAMAVVRALEDGRTINQRVACREFAAGKAWPVFGQRLWDLLEALDA